MSFLSWGFWLTLDRGMALMATGSPVVRVRAWQTLPNCPLPIWGPSWQFWREEWVEESIQIQQPVMIIWHRVGSLILLQFKMSKRGKPSRKKKNTDLEIGTEDGDERENLYHLMSPYMRLAEARKILGGELMPTKFKFRQQEVGAITKKMEEFLGKAKFKGSKILMITGSPGAGKTLCTNYVLQKCPHKVIALNSNTIKKKRDVQRILAEQLLGQEIEDDKLTTFKVISALEKAKSIPPCVLYIEEVELFFNSTKEYLSEDFFSLFSNKNLKIMLIGISNDIDALEKYGPKFNVGVSDVSNIVFNPYTIEEVKNIIEDKIATVAAKTGIRLLFTEKLVRYSANKMNEMKKGDMRIVFEFLRSLASKLLPKSELTSEEFEVTIQVVQAALQDLKIQKEKLINTIPFQQQVILIALHSYIAQYDDIFITEECLKKKVKGIYDALSIQPKKDIKQELSELEVYGFIEEKKKKDSRPGDARYLLKIPLSEIRYSFEAHPVLGKFFA